MMEMKAAAQVRIPVGRATSAKFLPVANWASVATFLSIVAQLALVLILLSVLEIEPNSGLPRILPLLLGGFVLHAALPLAYRLPFFLLLSLIAFVVVLGPLPAAILVALGLGLIGLCHLPVAFSTRVVLLFGAAGALAAFRTGWVPKHLISAAVLSPLVLPVLGSMFMFRLFIYLYDLRAEERERATGRFQPGRGGAPATAWMRLSYFFLLPNVCFLLFPIIDFRSFRRTYYDTHANEIYQKGLWWISLGLVHLILYRLVYHYLVPTPEQVQGLGGVVRLLTSSYLIYLRVSGLFHLITGLLCLFGFNLPPFHRFFFLASSFTDFWRRARIDWKDFMVKVFYYPALVPLQRRWGTLPAMAIATVAVFAVTWMLHSLQWFWLRGDFPLSQTDAVFWTIFGGCVLVNSLLEAQKKKRAVRAVWEFGPSLVHALKVLGMFVFLCVLWSYWSSPSFAAWWGLVSAAGDSGPGAYAVLIGALAAAVGVGVLAQYVIARSPAPQLWSYLPGWAPIAWRPIAVVSVATLLLLGGLPATRGSLGASATQFASTLSTNHLNAVDQEREDRSYYETLLDAPRSTAALATTVGFTGKPVKVKPLLEAADVPEPSRPIGGLDGNQPPNSEPSLTSGISAGTLEQGLGHIESEATASLERGRTEAPSDPEGELSTRPRAGENGVSLASTAANPLPEIGPLARQRFVRMTGDVLGYELIPSFTGMYKRAAFRTNQWGMRDKNYTQTPPRGTYRMALIGSSFSMGAGVAAEQTHEWLIEERLNREASLQTDRKYEILNFSVGGYGVLQNVAVVDRKVFDFAPHAILLVIHAIEQQRMVNHLSSLVQGGIAIPYPFVREKLRQAGVEAGMEETELRRRLQPISADLVRWSYRRIAELGRERNVLVIGIVFPTPRDNAERDLAPLAEWASEAGMKILSLEGVYDGHPLTSVRIGGDQGRDIHLNELGHRLVADRLYQLLSASDGRALDLRRSAP